MRPTVAGPLASPTPKADSLSSPPRAPSSRPPTASPPASPPPFVHLRGGRRRHGTGAFSNKHQPVHPLSRSASPSLRRDVSPPTLSNIPCTQPITSSSLPPGAKLVKPRQIAKLRRLRHGAVSQPFLVALGPFDSSVEENPAGLGNRFSRAMRSERSAQRPFAAISLNRCASPAHLVAVVISIFGSPKKTRADVSAP